MTKRNLLQSPVGGVWGTEERPVIRKKGRANLFRENVKQKPQWMSKFIFIICFSSEKMEGDCVCAWVGKHTVGREDKIYRKEHDTSWSSLQVLVRGACRGAEGDEAGGEAGASMGLAADDFRLSVKWHLSQYVNGRGRIQLV